MTLPTYKEKEQEFLEAMAKSFGFRDRCKLVFLERFRQDNDDLENKNLAEVLQPNLLESGEFALRDFLKQIFKKLEAAGCDFNGAKKDKCEIAKLWLREEIFPKWAKNPGSVADASVTDQMGPKLAEVLDAQGEIAGATTWRDEQHYNKFIGRSDERHNMLKYLEEDRPQIFSIVGMGGMGKTAFCHKVVSDTYNARIFSRVAWVRARVCEYKADLFGKPDPRMEASLTTEDALRKIGEELRIPNWVILGQDQEKLEQEICKVLEASRCLIVIDGLEDAESPGKLAEKLQQVLGKSSVILTSREQVDANVIRYQMTKMSRPVSREFIREIAEEKYSNQNGNPLLELPDSKMEKILDVTEGMPLAMKLFVSQVDVLSPDDAIEGLQTVSTERQLYDYLFEGILSIKPFRRRDYFTTFSKTSES